MMETKDIMMELAEKYPLGIETVKFPVHYDAETQIIWDERGLMICDIKGWDKIQFKPRPEKRQDEIENLIADLLNGFHNEVENFPSTLLGEAENVSYSREESEIF